MRLSKRYNLLSAVLLSFPMTALSVCGGSRAHADVGSTLPMAATPYSQLTSADTAIPYLMNKFEGPGQVSNDNGAGPSHWGINGLSNGLTGDQVRALTYQQAYDIYKTNYWDAMNIDSLPPDMRFPAFNAGVQFGPYVAEGMIDKANDNPYTLLNETSHYYYMLAHEPSGLYASSLPEWLKRNAMVAATLSLLPPRDLTPSASSVLPQGEAESAMTDLDPHSISVSVKAAPLSESAVPLSDNATSMADNVVADMADNVVAEHQVGGDPITLSEAELETGLKTALPEALDARQAIIYGGESAAPYSFLASIPFGALLRRRKKAKRNLAHRRRTQLDSEPPFMKPLAVPVVTEDEPSEVDEDISDIFISPYENGIIPPAFIPPQTSPPPLISSERNKGTFLPNRPKLSGFSERETEAFYEIYLPLSPVMHGSSEKWRIDHDAQSHTIVEKQKLTLKGNLGIEHTLLYAAQAWDNHGCVIEGASDEQTDLFVITAQRLVDEGRILPGFTIQGQPSFYPHSVPRPTPRTQLFRRAGLHNTGPQPIPA